MSDSRPTEWQWKTPEDGKIDGLTHAEWEVRGVDVFARRKGDDFPHFREKGCGGKFCDLLQYAPATLDGLPAAWPARMDWQWRKLERDMDARTWRSVPYWAHAGYVHEKHTPTTVNGGVWESCGPLVVAKHGEWWAPADQDGNPCEWPEVEPQPVVVIPAAEMTAQVLYGHQAMGGTWRRTYGNSDIWVITYACTVQGIDRHDPTEKWTPCDENGDFCELMRVVSEEWAGELEIQLAKVAKLNADSGEYKRRAIEAEKQEQRWFDEAKRQESACSKLKAERDEFRQQRDEWKILAARIVKLWDLGHGLGDVIVSMRLALKREGDEK